MKFRAILGAAVLVGAASHGGLVRSAGAAPLPEDRHRVLLIGVDGMDWNVVRPLLVAGKMPNFRKLMERGAYGEVSTVYPVASPVVWTSMATGKRPESHGIKGYLTPDGKKQTSDRRRCKAVWNILSEKRRRVCVVGYLVTHPVERVDGVMVSDWLLGQEEDFGQPPRAEKSDLVYPPEAIGDGPFWAWRHDTTENSRRLRRFMNFRFDPSHKPAPDFDPYSITHTDIQAVLRYSLAWAYPRDESYARLAERLLSQGEPADFTAVYFVGIDHAAHRFWVYYRPEGSPVSRRDVRRFGEVIPRYYEYIDELIGRTTKRVDEKTNVLIVSDHGGRKNENFGKSPDQPPGVHRSASLFLAAGPDIEPAGEVANHEDSVLDVTPTILALLGLSVARDMDGKVLDRLFTTEFKKEHPAAFVDTYETPRVAAPPSPPGLATPSPEERNRLKTLGYIH